MKVLIDKLSTHTPEQVKQLIDSLANPQKPEELDLNMEHNLLR